MEKKLSLVLTLLLLNVFSTLAVPTGFVDEGVATVQAITGAFAPNPRRNGQPMLLLSSKEGRINVLEDPDNSAKSMLIADFSNLTCSNGERGLQTILPHPDFATNRFIFIYYTRYTLNCPEDAILGPSNRLSRFTINQNTLLVNMGSELIIMETPPAVRNFHNGGSMAIGNDGYLYITTGDSGSREPPYAQDLRNLYGKLIRIDVTGKPPRSNPFSKASNGVGVSCRRNKGRPPPNAPPNATCEEIYAYGLRNPFRMAMDINTKNKVRLVIGDVGGSYWEEINEAGSDHVGTNYGWPGKHMSSISIARKNLIL
jgi:glucose/arabinose dehydrogenase